MTPLWITGEVLAVEGGEVKAGPAGDGGIELGSAAANDLERGLPFLATVVTALNNTLWFNCNVLIYCSIALCTSVWIAVKSTFTVDKRYTVIDIFIGIIVGASILYVIPAASFPG